MNWREPWDPFNPAWYWLGSAILIAIGIMAILVGFFWLVGP